MFVQPSTAPGVVSSPALSFFRRPWGQMLLIALAACASAFARNTLGPLQETMRLSLHWGDSDMALLQGLAPALASAAGAVPLGMLADRWPRARMLVGAALLALAATLVSGMTRDFALLFVARAAIGLSFTATLIAAFTLIADLFPPERRGRATMALSFGQVSGGSAVFAGGGYALVASVSWQAAMLWLAVPLVPCAAAMLLVRDPRAMAGLLGLFVTLGGVVSVALVPATAAAIPAEQRGLAMSLLVTTTMLIAVGGAPLMVSGLSGVLGGESAIGTAMAIVASAASLIAVGVFAWAARTFPAGAG